MNAEKEKKEKEKRKRRKEMQKLRKKLNPNNISKADQSKPHSFSANSLSIGPELPTQNDQINSIPISYSIIASNDYYKSIVRELLEMPTSVSSRTIIISFFSRILDEYEKVGNSQTDQETKKQWNDRVVTIRQSLDTLSNNMKKNHKTIPDHIILKLLEIRKYLLEGNVLKAESAYLDMDVGNMVVNNSDFFDLKIDVTVLFTCLTVRSKRGQS